MLDVAWPELLVIGAVTLVAVGPKDLPKVMHAMGRMAGKARRVMHDLHNHIEHLSFEAEMAEKKEAGGKTETKEPERDRET